MRPRSVATLLVQAFWLAACGGGSGGGGGDIEAFVQACLASSNLERPLCECTANKAREELSPEGFELLVAGMRGAEEEELAALRSELTIPEAAAAGMFMVRAPGECAREMGGG